MWQKFLAWATGVGHNLLEFMSPLATQIAKAGGTILTDAATAEVAAAEQAAAESGGDLKTGEQKFVAAQAGVVKTLTTQGIPVVMNAVNGAIEMAVANLNATKAQAAQPDPQAAAGSTASSQAAGTTGADNAAT